MEEIKEKDIKDDFCFEQEGVPRSDDAGMGNGEWESILVSQTCPSKFEMPISQLSDCLSSGEEV